MPCQLTWARRPSADWPTPHGSQINRPPSLKDQRSVWPAPEKGKAPSPGMKGKCPQGSTPGPGRLLSITLNLTAWLALEGMLLLPLITFSLGTSMAIVTENTLAQVNLGTSSEIASPIANHPPS